MRDYLEWHRQYDDPESGLSRRLVIVRSRINEFLDERPGPIRVVGLCSGDARDLLGVLATRADAERVSAVLVELDPTLAQRARDAAAEAGLTGITVVTGDAADTAHIAAGVPADLVLLVGVFGNITPDDIVATLHAVPEWINPGARLIWTRGTTGEAYQLVIDTLEAGPWRVEGVERVEGFHFAVGAATFTGEPVPFVHRERLFTFFR